MKKSMLRSLCIGITLITFATATSQEDQNSELFLTLKANDSILFGSGFNQCDMNAFEQFLAEDLEFYHDKGGILKSKKAFIENFKNGICGSPDYSSRRELVPGSLEVFPLAANGKIYGAIQKGVHRFYEQAKGKPEQAGSIAKFSHLWLLEEGQWKLARAFSYDHQMPVSGPKPPSVTLSDATLKLYEGSYQAPLTGKVDIKVTQGYLLVTAGKDSFPIYPKSENIFFHKQAPLTFEFKVDSSSEVSSMIVRENGKQVEEATKL